MSQLKYFIALFIIIIFICITFAILFSMHPMINIIIKRRWNSTLAKEALVFVESGNLTRKLPEDFKNYIFDNTTLENIYSDIYLRVLRNIPRKRFTRIKINYTAESIEGYINLIIDVNNSKVLITINPINDEKSQAIEIPVIDWSSVLYNNTTDIIHPTENINISFNGVFLQMSLSQIYEDQIVYGSIHDQILLFDRKLNIVLIFVLICILS